MSWSRFLIVRFVERGQHTSFLARFLFRPFRAYQTFGAAGPGAALRLPLAVISRAVGAETCIRCRSAFAKTA